MNTEPHYVVVTPVRNEEKYLPLTIESMAAQTLRPMKWIIVNDGSTDHTGKIADDAAKAHPWIQALHRADRGFRQAGGGVVDAFDEGYRRVENQRWDYLVKLDGDLSFEVDYFERCFARFDETPCLGIAGGTICSATPRGIEVESKIDPRFHVRGATKIYRAACWQAIGGLIHAPGWDTLDEVKANMLGWSTQTLPEMKVIHHRPTGAAYGTWKDRVKGGTANYISGYHPLFMVIKCMRRSIERPYLFGSLALLFGYLKARMNGTARVDDRALIHYFQQQQMRRLLGKKSLWS
jgi:glycosyltransferase involved in cell wall biosynthesis